MPDSYKGNKKYKSRAEELWELNLTSWNWMVDRILGSLKLEPSSESSEMKSLKGNTKCYLDVKLSKVDAISKKAAT